jgi:hypothetical protein
LVTDEAINVIDANHAWSAGSWSAMMGDHKVGGTWGNVMVKKGDVWQVQMLSANIDDQKYNKTASK